MKSSLSLYLSRNKEATEEISGKQNLDRYKFNKMPCYYFEDMGMCNYEKPQTRGMCPRISIVKNSKEKSCIA